MRSRTYRSKTSPRLCLVSLSCRFFIRGEPPNKNAAVLTETHAVGERSETCRQTGTSARFHPQIVADVAKSTFVD